MSPVRIIVVAVAMTAATVRMEQLTEPSASPFERHRALVLRAGGAAADTVRIDERPRVIAPAMPTACPRRESHDTRPRLIIVITPIAPTVTSTTTGGLRTDCQRCETGGQRAVRREAVQHLLRIDERRMGRWNRP